MISLAQAESRLGKLFVFGTRHVNVDFNYDIYDAVCMVLTIHHSQWDST